MQSPGGTAVARRTLRHLVAWTLGMIVIGEPMATVRAIGPSEAQTVVPLSDGFEEDDYRRFTTRCAEGCPSTWERITPGARTGTYAFHAADVPTASDSSLLPNESLIIPVNASAAALTFWHRFDFEQTDKANFFDGGVLEVSTDNGATWGDAGSNITAGGYTGAIADIPTGNPLAGRAAWVGTQVADWQQVSVNLLSYRGEPFTFRLRLGTDSSNLGIFPGWFVDDIQVSYQAPLASCARSWSAVRPYPVPVAEAAAVGVGGVLYVFGGVTSNGATADAYKYSPANDAWTPIASLPEPRTGTSAVTDGTYIYVVGGAVGDSVATTLWRYDPAANNYATLAPLITGTAYHGAAFITRNRRGYIYRVGGLSDLERDEYTTVVEAYSISDDQWANVIEPHPEALGRLAALGLERYVYTAGGSNGDGTSLKTYRYDAENDVWEDEQIADLPSRAGTIGAFYKGAWLLSAGGSALAWDPATNRWRSLDQIPQFVGPAAAAVVGDAFYLVGGVAGMAPITTVQRYIETDCASPTPTATSQPLPTSTPPIGPACVGDCGGDGTVAVAELIRGVNVALGLQPLSACPAFDSNRNGTVAVNELVAAVNNALNDCP